MKIFNLLFSCLTGVLYIFFFRLPIIAICEILCILLCTYSKKDSINQMFENSILIFGVGFFGIAIRNIFKMHYSAFMTFAIFEMVFIFISVFVTFNCILMYFIKTMTLRKDKNCIED